MTFHILNRFFHYQKCDFWKNVQNGHIRFWQYTLDIVSYCAILTLSLRRAVFTIFDFKKCHDLEMGSKITQDH